VTSYQYYPDSNVQMVNYSGSVTPAVNFTYDQYFNRMTSISDGTGLTTYQYNPIGSSPSLGAGRLASVDGPLSNDTITYAYDALGRIQARAINAVTNSMVYDALGRVTSVTNALGGFTYAYTNQTDRLLSVAYPNGQTNSYSYLSTNGDFRLSQILNKNVSGTALSEFDYQYNAQGEITSWTQQYSGGSTNVFNLSYDSIDRLLGATVKDGVTQSVVKRYLYGYDQAGNRQFEKIDGAITQAGYNAGNQLASMSTGGILPFVGRTSEAASVSVAGSAATMTSSTNFMGSAQMALGTNTVSIVAMNSSGSASTNNYQMVVTAGGQNTLLYDLNGDLTQVSTNGISQTSYEWDALNRLIAVNESSTNRTEFTYDGLGRRVRIVEKTNGAVTSDKRFVWCNTELCEERDSSGGTVNKRFFAQGVQLSTTNYFYTTDHLGSIREVVDSSGTNVVARYSYDPYGRRTLVSGSDLADFGFTGHYVHKSSGLYLAPYRAYDPNLGRWLSRDPLGESGGLNLYGYVGNDPVNWLDLLGLIILPPNFIGPLQPGDVRAPSWDVYTEGPWQGTSSPIGDMILFGIGGLAAGEAGICPVGASSTAGGDIAGNAAVSFASKAAARAAVDEMGLSDAQAAAVKSAIGRATSSSTIDISVNEGGDVTVSISRAGVDGKQVMESIVSPNGAKTVVQKAFDSTGKQVHYDPK